MYVLESTAVIDLLHFPRGIWLENGFVVANDDFIECGGDTCSPTRDCHEYGVLVYLDTRHNVIINDEGAIFDRFVFGGFIPIVGDLGPFIEHLGLHDAKAKARY